MTERPSQRQALPAPFPTVQVVAAIVGVVGMIGIIVGLILQPQMAFRSYLYGYLFWLGLSLGSMAFAMITFLVGGEWGLIARRPFEAGAAMVPLMAILFIPIGFGLPALYPWARPDVVAADEILRHKAAYLNPALFDVRAAVYLICWSLLAMMVVGHSGALDRRPDDVLLQERTKRICAGGLVLYVITMTFAGVDWIMSRDPHWYSTIYGFILCAGQAVLGLSVAIIVLTALRHKEAPALIRVVRPGHFGDLGSILLTTVILFAYLQFAQFLIVWVGNKQDEITWYVLRTQGVWGWIIAILVVIHFFIPFFLLLSRYNKQTLPIIAGIAALLVIARLVELFWWVAPAPPAGGSAAGGAEYHVGFSFYWTDAVAPLGIGGIWLAAYVWVLGRRPLLPLHHLPLPEPLHDAGHEAPGSVG
jgi:hypothetical protein